MWQSVTAWLREKVSSVTAMISDFTWCSLHLYCKLDTGTRFPSALVALYIKLLFTADCSLKQINTNWISRSQDLYFEIWHILSSCFWESLYQFIKQDQNRRGKEGNCLNLMKGIVEKQGCLLSPLLFRQLGKEIE